MATAAFGPLEIAYDDDVLTPRPWTLEQARWAVELSTSAADGPVLELCCGAGQIGLVVAVETGRRLVQVDDDERACAWAQHNAATAGATTEVRCAAIDAALSAGERFALVLADPPYVPSDDARALAEDPSHAIDGGADGLDVVRQCLRLAADHVAPGGVVLLQTRGRRQALGLEDHARDLGLALADVREFGEDRAVALLQPREQTSL